MLYNAELADENGTYLSYLRHSLNLISGFFVFYMNISFCKTEDKSNGFADPVEWLTRIKNEKFDHWKCQFHVTRQYHRSAMANKNQSQYYVMDVHWLIFATDVDMWVLRLSHRQKVNYTYLMEIDWCAAFEMGFWQKLHHFQ